MDFNDTDPKEDSPAAKTPEDSSALYSWANLHGVKYRDFCALRREARAPARHRAGAQEGEQQSQIAVPAEAVAYQGGELESPLRPARMTDEAHRSDGVERRKGVRRVESAMMAEAVGQSGERKERIPASAQSVGVRKIYREASYQAPAASHTIFASESDFDLPMDTGTSPVHEISDPLPAVAQIPTKPTSTEDSAGPAWLYSPSTVQVPPKPLSTSAAIPQPSVADTLQYSRERVASRWFALKGVFEQPGTEHVEAAALRQKETRTPVLAVFSLAGGVGKTSLVATIGRSLSSMGEKVLLNDTTSHGLLPFYFGASELQYDTVRTFSPPSGSTDAPIYLISHDMERKGIEEGAQNHFIEEVVANSGGMHRILLDLAATSSWVIREMARMNLTVLVPVAPDMNSVISLGFVEKFFSGLIDGDGRPLLPFYVLNQFDPSLPLHLDIREVLRRKLGDRLLPFVIRRTPSVSEALAEGMTVVDYAPDAPIAEDYTSVVTWLRSIAAPASAGFRNVRWSES